MEYFQIEERFGKRPAPRLELYLETDGIRVLPFGMNTPARWFALSLQNRGSGIAKFPSIRYKRASGLEVHAQGPLGLPRFPSDNEWEPFRGGVDEVIYPQENRKIAQLTQRGTSITWDVGGGARTEWAFAAVTFQCEISCEGAPTKAVEKTIPEESTAWP
jgi:hypothetical protein